jgi:energy-coupling factor transporter ATP-binding protein EcfA2
MNAAQPVTLPRDARTRLPREPYPGLRPFLDFEAALLFGRERQVREVIDRLRETQFVAVLGGSGSGKSSLIHAGVVPELRSFGIPGAGDLWLPMTCTPGTNVSAEDTALRRHSPITRLARRFGQLLHSRGSEQADAARDAEIAEVFRQEAGFARLLDTYGTQLAVPPGPDPNDARVLFVLDQFEEIFHPTNKGVTDASLLVERVLDHFFNPHPRCYVVLTMRSEHLNDCAAFLELPDAINKSSFLIRRLDDGELRDAITGPAQRFLRLMARSAADRGPDEPALPAEVRFEPVVLDRLLRDVKAITHDPDHLPLLQHLLARLWEAALEREEMDVPVPAHITEIDLVRAVTAGRVPVGDEQPLPERLNTLRACVDNWPESLYRWHGPEQQAQLDALFRHLAFKDPNTGLYSQQRIDVDEAARLLGAGITRNHLRALLAEGFLGSVDYLFWDDEDPSRITLKVSHESFIRGWQRFRELIDRESEHFDEFLHVLRQCAGWVASGEQEDFLLETGEMRRLRDSGFEQRLARPEQRRSWFRLLLLDRDGARLSKLDRQLDVFLATSNRRLKEREHKAGRARRNWLLLGAATLLLAPSALFSVLIQGPVTERAELLFDAGNRANRAPLTPDYPGIGAAALPLESLLTAAELIDDARTGRAGAMAQLSERLLTDLAWIPPVRRQDAFLAGVAAQAEPPVNGKLRQLLTTALWAAPPRGADDEALGEPLVMEASCVPATGEGVREALVGRLFVAGGGRSGGASPRRAVFVPRWSGDSDTAIHLRGASYDAQTGQCSFGPIVQPIPLYLDPYIVFDAGLRYFAHSAEGPNIEVPSVTLQEIDWERADDRSTRIVQATTRAIVTDPAAVAQLRRTVGPERVAVTPTWRQTGGRAFAVGGQGWRLVSPAAQRLPLDPGDPAFTPLRAAGAGSACATLATGWAAQPGFGNQMLESDESCFAVSRGNPPGDEPPAAAPRDQVLVAIYDKPDRHTLGRLADNPPAPIAALAPFARVAPGEGEWLVGTRGPYAGWLALRAPDGSGQPRLLGVPWSTCALWRLGRELLPPERREARQAARGHAAGEVCQDR